MRNGEILFSSHNTYISDRERGKRNVYFQVQVAQVTIKMFTTVGELPTILGRPHFNGESTDAQPTGHSDRKNLGKQQT